MVTTCDEALPVVSKGMSNEHNSFALNGRKRKLEDLTKTRRQILAELAQNDKDRKVGRPNGVDPQADI